MLPVLSQKEKMLVFGCPSLASRLAKGFAFALGQSQQKTGPQTAAH
jgi:hypothetical protein